MKLFFNIVLITFLSVSISFAQSVVSTFRAYIQDKDFEKAEEVAQKVLTENPKDATLAVEVGDVYYELEDYTNAFDAYSKARNIDNSDNKIVAKLAKSMIALNKSKDAIEVIDKVLKKDKQNVSLLITLASAYLASNDVKNAELQIMNARNYDDKNAEVYSMLGDIYYNQSIWELARNNYEDALKYDSTNVPARQKLAETYWQLAVQANDGEDMELLNEYLNRSLFECNMLVRNNPKDANSWRLKGKIHYNAGQNLEAAQSYNKFLELRPNNFKERWRLSELFALGNNPEQAIPNLVEVVKSNHSDITDSIRHKAELYLGSCYYKVQDYSNAVATLNNIDKKSPLEPIDLKLLALAYLFAQDTTNSLTAFDRLLSVAPVENCGDVILNVARIYNARKQFENVIKTINISINNNCPDDKNTPYLYYLLGTANFELKNIAAAIDALQKAIQINPQYYFVYIYLGDIYYNQKNNVEGEKQFRFVIDNAKTDVATNANVINMAFQKLAGNRLETKKYNDIVTLGKEWLTLITENNELANLYLAIAYHGLQNKDQACKYYNEVLKINPENKTAKDNKKSLGC
jgi:tetratricopeptide (TPR) repeat protein